MNSTINEVYVVRILYYRIITPSPQHYGRVHLPSDACVRFSYFAAAKCPFCTGIALLENNQASAKLTTANGGTFTLSSASLSSQSRYRSLDQ